MSMYDPKDPFSQLLAYQGLQYGTVSFTTTGSIISGGSGSIATPNAQNQSMTKKDLKVGMSVRWKDTGEPGIIGAIEVGDFYVYSNCTAHMGSMPRTFMKDRGPYLYSWVFRDMREFNELVEFIDTPKKVSKPIKIDSAHLDRLVMKDEAKAEILAVLRQHEHSEKLFNDWGLGEVIEYGRGMTLLFHGGPGTGKTWGANCIAKSIGTELLVIAAGDIQSSEPGGANRAITDAFKEAKKSGKVLFLDECDSLITVRSEVGMILGSEINTLLTEIEKFEGVCILATNRIGMMDEALERRIALIVEFPSPDYEARKLIWEKLLPKKMPLDEDVDITKLAEYSLTGGQIKNAVLQAARLALSDERPKVGKKHFEKAIKRIQDSKGLVGRGSELLAKVRSDYKKS